MQREFIMKVKYSNKDLTEWNSTRVNSHYLPWQCKAGTSAKKPAFVARECNTGKDRPKA
jgi:hypothetical protein